MKEKILVELMETKRPGIDDLCGWLKMTDFFTAPASRSHHLAVPCGLARHSWNVYDALLQMRARHTPNMPWESAKICGLLHDVCKIGIYREDIYGRYDYSYDGGMGHGEKSVIILQRFIKLTEEEALAIRWHMGAWHAEGGLQREWLNAAIDHSELVRAMIAADQHATFFTDTEETL